MMFKLEKIFKTTKKLKGKKNVPHHLWQNTDSKGQTMGFVGLK